MHYKDRVPADEFVPNHPRRLFIQSLFERGIVISMKNRFQVVSLLVDTESVINFETMAFELLNNVLMLKG